jgi:tetratricopeptide (TPR) repeat protein
LAGRPAEAVDQLLASVRLEPNYYRPYIFLVVALAELGYFSEAIAAAEKAVRLSDDPLPKAFMSYAYFCAGRTADAEKIFLELQELGKTRVISPMISAGAHVQRGDLDRALDYLEQACEIRESEVIYLRSFPIWRPLHDHPRFKELIRRMKFPD